MKIKKLLEQVFPDISKVQREVEVLNQKTALNKKVSDELFSGASKINTELELMIRDFHSRRKEEEEQMSSEELKKHEEERKILDKQAEELEKKRAENEKNRTHAAVSVEAAKPVKEKMARAGVGTTSHF